MQQLLPPPSAALTAALPLFRAATPAAQGVVLASASGEPVAHDLGDARAAGWVASAAVTLHHEACGAAPLARPQDGASVFVQHEGRLVLVVFVDAPGRA